MRQLGASPPHAPICREQGFRRGVKGGGAVCREVRKCQDARVSYDLLGVLILGKESLKDKKRLRAKKQNEDYDVRALPSNALPLLWSLPDQCWPRVLQGRRARRDTCGF